jgi:DNA polymerase III delta prime subunit
MESGFLEDEMKGGSLGFGVELSSGRRDRNEQILLDVVGREVRDRTNQSLNHTVLLTLGKGKPSCSEPLPRQGQLRLADGSHSSLSTEAAIGALFDHPILQGRLLVAGPTGVGKTTFLLALAAELIQRANCDPGHPLPVLFHLSSWPADQQSFEDWLLVELQLKYGVSKKLSHQWLEANLLLPLLDGLDELHPDRREPAVQQINEWLGRVSGAPVVCCCGDNDDRYPTNLNLNGTLELDPLAPEQIEKYLNSLGLSTIWMRLHKSFEHLDLTRIPLWLNLLILTKDNLDFAFWERLKTPQDRQNHLMDSFILQQLHLSHPPNLTGSKTIQGNPPPPQQTRHWLGWLARHIDEQSEHEFLIENLQPNLLSNRKQIIQYSVLGGLIFGLMGGLVFGLFIGPGSGLFVTSVIATLFIVRRGDDAIATIDAKPTTTSLMQFIFIRQLNQLLFFLLMGIAVVAFYAEGIGSFIFLLVVVLIVGLLVRLTIALPSWLIGSFVFKINRYLEAEVAVRTAPNQSIQETLLYVVRSTAMFMPLLLLINLTPLFWSGKLAGQIALEVTPFMHVFGIIAAISLWATIFNSALTCAQHLALRLVLFGANAIPWNYARFLNGCCVLHLLQRVGGRYQFIHPLVQERFAEM